MIFTNRILNIILSVMALGIFLVQNFTDIFKPPANDISNLSGHEIEVSGFVRDEIQISQDIHGIYKLRFSIDVESARINRSEKIVTGGMTIYSRFENREDIPEILIGDRIQAHGTPRKPTRYNNPGQIDIPMLLLSQGITAQMSTRNFKVEKNLAPDFWDRFKRLIVEIREHYRELLRSSMKESDAATIFAILFGGYQGLDESLVESFTATGIVHILSVSGSHITLLAATISMLGNLFRLPKLLTAGFVLIVISIYGMLAGFVPPVFRAAVMGSLTFMALALDRDNDARRYLAICSIFMLAYEPLLFFHISFQLSFAATAGLLYIAPRLKNFFEIHQFPKLISLGLSVTLSTQIASIPIIAWYFNQFSISSIIANLIVTPILEILIVVSLFTGIIGLILPFIAQIIFALDAIALNIAASLIDLLAKIPLLYLPTMHFISGGIYYAILLWILNTKNLPTIKLTIGRILIFGFAIAILIAIQFRPRDVEIHFIDVHQGDCALLITPHGRAAMFDTGGIRELSFDIGSRIDIPYLKHYGVTKLDYIFLTHAHEDHSGGAGSIIKKFPVEKVFTGHEDRSEYSRAMGLSQFDPLLDKLEAAREGTVINLDGVKIEVIYAPAAASHGTGNEVSNVYRVSYGNASFLFTGDLVKEQESILLSKESRAKKVRSTVLKVGHHGSHTSSSDEFIAAVNPRFAVFCVGLGNSFGHPRAEVVEAFEKSGARILRTDLDGAIIFRTNGKKLSVEKFVEE